MQQSLLGYNVLVTCAPDLADALSQHITDRGGRPLRIPLTAVVPADDPGPLDAALHRLHQWDWVVFTSPNAVGFVGQRLATLGHNGAALPTQWPTSCRVAAVGPGTAAQLAPWGVGPILLPKRYRWQELAEALVAAAAAGQRVLLPRSDRAQPELPAALRRAGLAVTEVIAYHTRLLTDNGARVAELFKSGQVDVVTLTSPSAVEVLVRAWTPIFNGARPGAARDAARVNDAPSAGFGRPRPVVACIGPNTAAVARAHGLPVDVVPPRAGAAALAAAIAQFFETHGGAQ